MVNWKKGWDDATDQVINLLEMKNYKYAVDKTTGNIIYMIYMMGKISKPVN